ncbi:hypothetical protein COW36_24005 [bacterium (Candidatus Blackallbacteria) CG17_big_fil_post_rev_8_21_14_2_50_48_46]|uniref:Acetoacetate decarboxylase n=1 Tax=bacterium (Candidatus Blackallbacteria) CG17_big_fil_post_rev_8_21_14_2_50_48_46 TaxID=2014261 RepID=A0A2M7FY94_9BACT|nr:MAG: hypothetical protein COW64_18945 [bacterium (Candidatus Blackallbacteria) CG18_big_fil_WC_8_21_14_2_50_49_26]PIW13736.1 MAG: hypothetical protein COW36_24005 [bacterium (Candidatus Blackallbacteria) CG17_big_fil_post_rev_8_21_14_2_50_48_46]PIW44962.1 MAG: hypothetical protein COW20_21635 [bacterium (Candidatus Blackallbacteria) CG13_big_fil_rev_8_21_14_2_50_49_14]
MSRHKSIFEDLQVTTDGQSGIEMPIRLYRSEIVVSYFECGLEPLLPMMPHERVHPVRRGNNRSALAMIQTHVQHGSIPPYRSVAIAIPVTLGKWPAPSYLPLWFEESWGNKGFYIYKEGVSSSEAFEARTEIWGYPIFLAEINHQMLDPRTQETELIEEERILTLRVKRPEYVREQDKELKFYSIKQNIVCENKVKMQCSLTSSRSPEASMVVFGKHPVGAQLKSMGIGPYSLETFYYFDAQAILPYPDYLD